MLIFFFVLFTFSNLILGAIKIRHDRPIYPEILCVSVPPEEFWDPLILSGPELTIMTVRTGRRKGRREGKEDEVEDRKDEGTRKRNKWLRIRNRRIRILKIIRRREGEMKLKKDIRKNPWSCMSSLLLMTSVGKGYNTSQLFHFS